MEGFSFPSALDWMVFLRKALDRVSARYISEPGLYLRSTLYRWSRNRSLCRPDLELKREASCKSISEVCGQPTKSLVFQMCNDDCALARRPELEVLSQSENISVLLG